MITIYDKTLIAIITESIGDDIMQIECPYVYHPNCKYDGSQNKDCCVICKKKWLKDTKYVALYTQTISKEEKETIKCDIIQLRKQVLFDFYVTDKIFVLKLFDKKYMLSDNTAINPIWARNHSNLGVLFKQALAYCEIKNV